MINNCARFCILTEVLEGRRLVGFQVHQFFSSEKQAQPFWGARPDSETMRALSPVLSYSFAVKKGNTASRQDP